MSKVSPLLTWSPVFFSIFHTLPAVPQTTGSPAPVPTGAAGAAADVSANDVCADPGAFDVVPGPETAPAASFYFNFILCAVDFNYICFHFFLLIILVHDDLIMNAASLLS